MSNETSEPSARIAVEYVLGAEDPFKFSTDTDTASRVTVETDGTIRISWQGDDQQAQLHFTLISSPGNSFFDGFLLGWRESELPINGPQPLSYSVEALPTEELLRTLVVKLGPGKGTCTYLLYVAHQTEDGLKIGQADPKIYNEGDGGGGGHR